MGVLREVRVFLTCARMCVYAICVSNFVFFFRVCSLLWFAFLSRWSEAPPLAESL
jgi:hypothetical protein